MNRAALIAVGTSVAIACLAVQSGCAAPRRVAIFDRATNLPAERFVGPVHIDVPRRRAHDLEVRVTLSARCAPRLIVRFPDGETQSIGARNPRWQALLAARAEAVAPPSIPAEPTSEPDEPAVEPAVADSASGAASEPASEPAIGPGGGPARETGRWVERDVDSWPGQLEFERLRQKYCARTGTWTATSVIGYDELGRVSVWAEVPQELAAARVVVDVAELITGDEPEERAGRRLAKRGQAKPLPAEPRTARTYRAKPDRPEPKPKREKPRPAKAEGATWTPGHWSWSGRAGKWVWTGGHWSPPARAPALRVEAPGDPPVTGCTWRSGRWVWVPGNGSWRWNPGYWNPPPPRVEERGQPAGPGAPWYKGRWQRQGKTFVWNRGRWGRPASRREDKPPRPSVSARWMAGFWHATGGTYKWIPGRWIGGGGRAAPPPPRAENKPPAPAPGAIWLAGFWRLDGATGKYQWVPGHYELPPGKDYTWVPDPPLPSGQVVGGRWQILVEVAP